MSSTAEPDRDPIDGAFVRYRSAVEAELAVPGSSRLGIEVYAEMTSAAIVDLGRQLVELREEVADCYDVYELAFDGLRAEILRLRTELREMAARSSGDGR